MSQWPTYCLSLLALELGKIKLKWELPQEYKIQDWFRSFSWFNLFWKILLLFWFKPDNLTSKTGSAWKSLRIIELPIQPEFCHLMPAVFVGCLTQLCWNWITWTKFSITFGYQIEKLGFIRISWPDQDHIQKRSWAYDHESYWVCPLLVNYRITHILHYFIVDRNFPKYVSPLVGTSTYPQPRITCLVLWHDNSQSVDGTLTHLTRDNHTET